MIQQAFGADTPLGASLDELCKAAKDGFNKYGNALMRLEDRVSKKKTRTMPTPKMVSDAMSELAKTLSSLVVKDQEESKYRDGHQPERRSPSPERSSSPGSGVCHYCGQAGHWRASCPRKYVHSPSPCQTVLPGNE